MALTLGRPPRSPEAEALIEEARRITKRRRRLLAGLLGVVLAAAGVGIGLGVGGSTSSAISTQQPSFAKAIMSATQAEGSADLTLSFENRVPGYCTRGQELNVGQINFAQQAIAFATTSVSHDQLNCNQFPAQVRQIGTALYVKFLGHTCGGSSCKPLPSQMGWSNLQANSSISDGDASSILRTPYPFVVLQAIRSPVHGVGSAKVGGIRVNKFTATLTLADVQAYVARATGQEHESLAGIGSESGGIPPSSSIKISVTAWIDAANRLVQIAVRQPYYVVNPAQIGSMGATQYPPDHGQPGAVPSGYSFLQGYTMSTLALSRFGVPVDISQPTGLLNRSGLPGA